MRRILCFFFVSVPPFSKNEQFPFPPGSQVYGSSARCPASSISPMTHLASSQESADRGCSTSPRTSGQSRLGPREFGEDAPPSVLSSPTLLRCTTTGTSIAPLEPLAWHLEAWLTPPSLSRWLTRTIRLGSLHLHLESVCGRYGGPPRCSGRPVPGKA